MKISELKKILKGCVATVRVAEYSPSQVFTAAVQIHEPGKAAADTLVIVEAQANDLLSMAHRTSYRTDQEAKQFRSFPAVGPFYAVKIETETRYGYGGSDYKNPETAAAFFKLISAIVEDKNLRYVYPDCELSQVIAALEALGCNVDDVTVDRKDFAVWRRERQAEVEAHQARNQPAKAEGV